MGASSSTPEEISAEIDRDVRFWGTIVDLSLTGLPRVAIGPFQCDSSRLQEALRRTSRDISCLGRPRVNHLGRALPSPELHENLAGIASTLMEWDPELCHARQKLVPVRVPENVFWANYFDAMRIHVLLFFLHFPATEGAYFGTAYELLRRIAWTKEQLIVNRPDLIQTIETNTENGHSQPCQQVVHSLKQ
mmetsp:Transcript_11577/g.21965  ORF Transcript_11577/g.21965 Transcript_11577/m.21965 type:complete len:191 (-) Transcript_11577:204-776(-)|eukprot:CAMPEP_0114248752 /NCGR_PEP_ID=MMETSP0058-20121206/13750_1 /TAXON_ID=36894 /ORGANISM="Pyramimonas parkeae, CCMP726" /LENGTH=190 /DNA_ID=CAMNT_0001362199 /DNA_START=141 /DNA_END=713 /DNA_ORIENTATION=-